MPRGGARTGAGRPRKPLSEHGLAGTYRPDRHGQTAANVLLMPQTSAAWSPTESDLSRMGDAGRELLARFLDRYEPTEVEAVQLLEAAHASDVLAQLRAEAQPDLKQIRLWSAFFTATIRMLGLS